MPKIAVLLFLLPFAVLAQRQDTITRYYSDGTKRFETKTLGDDKILFIEYFSDGKVKDSVGLHNDVPFGVRKMYHKNGRLKYKIEYVNGPAENFYARYWKDGNLRATGGTKNFDAFGIQQQFNRKGKLIRYQDMNKGRLVKVPTTNKGGRHVESSLRGQYPAEEATLEHADKGSKKIKTGALISLKLRKDSNVTHHYQVEGFKNDAILVSVFDYDTVSATKNTLRLNRVMPINLTEVETIYFGKNRPELADAVALGVTTAGCILFVAPLVIVPVLSGADALTEPENLTPLLIGPPLYFWGRHLSRKTVPKAYDLHAWKLVPR